MKVAIISSFDESLINFRLDLIKDLISQNCDIHVVAPSFEKKNKKIFKKLNIKISKIHFNRTKISPFLDILTIYKFYSFKK